jgi:hypothetical protein
VQDKVWVHGPDAEPWEIYTVLADAPVMHEVPVAGEAAEGSACCTSAPVEVSASVTASSCC